MNDTNTNIVTKSPVPRKLNPGMITALSEAIKLGNYYSTACSLCGIYESTLYDWIKLAAKDLEEGCESEYTRLHESLKKAEAVAEAERVERIRQAGVGGQVSRRVTRERRDGTVETEETYQLPQWLADMTHLERRHPDRWGRKDRTVAPAEGAKVIQISRVIINYGEQPPEVVEGEARELPGSEV